MTIKAGQWPAFIVMILFWFYFSELSNRDYKNKYMYLVTGDWGQSYSHADVSKYWRT